MAVLFMRRLPPNQYCPNLGVQLLLTSCVTYDKLIVNERQKKDPQVSFMLDCGRRECSTEETVC